jgi:prepilin-type processing-associated H-X9-DG protein
MNQRINYPLAPETPFRVTQAVHPSAFVVFSEQRVHASETPYYGTNPTDLSSTYNYCNRFSGRHNAGGNIVFSDAHAAYFKYSYVCMNYNNSPQDPGDPDINWPYTGAQLPP